MAPLDRALERIERVARRSADYWRGGGQLPRQPDPLRRYSDQGQRETHQHHQRQQHEQVFLQDCDCGHLQRQR